MQEPEKELDESFTMLCVVGLMVLTQPTTLDFIKSIFARALLSVPFEDLLTMPEYAEARRRLEDAGFDVPELLDDGLEGVSEEEVSPCE